MHKKQSPHPSLIDVKLWAEKSDTALHRHLFFLIPERKKEGKERRKEGEKVREIRAALLKRVLLPSVLRATGPSGPTIRSFIRSHLLYHCQKRTKAAAAASALAPEERRAIRFPPTSSSPSPLLPPRPFPSCLLKFLSGISGQWREGP